MNQTIESKNSHATSLTCLVNSQFANHKKRIGVQRYFYITSFQEKLKELDFFSNTYKGLRVLDSLIHHRQFFEEIK